MKTIAKRFPWTVRLLAVTVVLMLASYRSWSQANNGPCGQTLAETLQADSQHYLPGDTATLTGSGFAPSCEALIAANLPDGTVENASALTDASGNFSFTYSVGPSSGDYSIQALTTDGATALATAQFSSGIFVITDKGDYQPGDTPIFSGRGFQPGEAITLLVHQRYPGGVADRIFTALAEDSGAFVNSDFVVGDQDLNATLSLTATGQSSGLRAMTMFRDGAATWLQKRVNNTANSGAPTVSLSISPGAANNLLVAIVGAGGTSTISPSAGWSTAINESGVSSPGQAIFYMLAPSTSSQTLTATLSPSTTATLVLYEYSGILASSNPFEAAVGGSTGSDTNPITKPITATSTTDLLIGGVTAAAPAGATVNPNMAPTSVQGASFMVETGTGGSATIRTGSNSTTRIGSQSADSLTSPASAFTGFTLDATPAGWRGQIAAFKTKTDTTTMVTSSLNPAAKGASVTFTATVTPASGGPATGTVLFKDGTNNISGCTAVALTGNPATATCTSSSLTAGSHTISATYSGNTTDYFGSIGSMTQNVGTTTTSTPTSTLNPSAFGQSVTFTTSVTADAGGVPTSGTVTFRDNGSTMGCTNIAIGTATVTCTTSSLVGGSHPITADYNGNAATYASSTSDSLTQVVNPATPSVSLVSSGNPAGFGQSVTLTATVAPVPPNTPRGTINFLDGASTIGTCGAVLVNSSGIATCATSALSAGAHSITAVYSGNNDFSGATSPVLPQYITGCPYTVDGSGATAGGFTTVQAAVDALPSLGPCTVNVLAGTYGETVSISSKNSGAVAESSRIVIQRNPAAAIGSVIIDAGGATTATVSVSGSKFITLKGLDIRGSNRQGIVLVGSPTNSNVTIDSNLIHDNNPGSSANVPGGIDINANNSNIVVVNNLVRNNGRDGISTANGTSNIYIVNNTIYGSGFNGMNWTSGSSNTTFLVNNLIAGNGTTSGSTSGRFGINHTNSAVPANITLVNNVFYNNTGGDFASPSTDFLDATDSGNRTTTGTETPASAIAGCTFADCLSTHTSNEIFTDTATNDLHLKTTSPMSPAIDKGLDHYVSGGADRVPTADGADNPATARPQANGGASGVQTDVGYDEATSLSVSTTTAVSSSVNPSTYGGSVSFTATITPSGATGSVQFVVDGVNFGASVPVSGGTATSGTTSSLTVGNHPVTANFVGTGAYTDSSGTLSGGQTVNMANQTISFGALAGKTYGDADFNVSATATSGLAVTFTASGNCTIAGTLVHITGAGSCTVTAHQAGDSNYNAAPDVPQTFSIAKANATISVTPYSVTYDAAAHTATGTATGVGGADLSAGLTLTGTTHTNAGTYNGDAWTFAGGTNYNDANGTVDDAIAKANATISVTPYSVTYNAAAHTATGTATGVGGADLSAGLNLTGTTHTNAGTYNGDAWTFTGGTNYNDANGTVDDAIAKATATISVTPYSVTYDGLAHTATGTATGVGGADLSAGLNLSGTTHTSAGTFSDSWSFTGGTNYNDASGSVSDVIAKANAAISVTPYSVTYDGLAHTATGTATGVGGADLSAGLNLTGTTHTDAGTYNGDPWTFSGGTNYNDASGSVNDSIAQAATTITWSDPADITYGTALDGTQLNATASVPGSFVYTPAAGTVLPAADGQTLSVAFTPTDATNYSGSTKDVLINVKPYGLTVSGITANDKVYDRTTVATLNMGGAALVGIQGSDDVTLDTGSAVGAFADFNVGAGKTVSISGLTIGGAQAGNYTLTQPTATASITELYLTVSGITANNKIYDGGTTATIVTTGAALDGVISPDVVTLDASGASGAFSTKTVGTGKTVQISGLTISGNANYALTQPTATADITAKQLTASYTGVDKVYDGSNSASVTGGSLTGVVSGDDVTLSGSPSATFASKNVPGGTVTVTGVSLAGADAGNYTLFAPITTSAAITPRALAVTATGVSRTYDATTAATVTLSDDRIGSDSFTSSYTSASFADKNVGTGKSVSVSGISISGADAVNYTANTTASATANITAKSLTVSAAGVNKVYDGLTSATVTLSDDRISGDVVTDNYTSASFATRNVGTGIAVSVSGISISGTDSGNYSLTSTTASASADITGRPLTISATGVNKVYDGSTTATVGLTDNRVSGDVFADSYTSASFSDKNVGTAKAVSVSGISISGVDAGNYTYNTTASTTADITAKSLTASFTASSKVYDGSTSAAVSGCALTGVVSPDDVSCAASNGQFDNASVGAGKTVTADVALSGADSGNYSVAATATSTADITKASLTVTGITASDKVYDQTTSATLNVAGAALVGVVSGDTVTLDTSAAVGTFSDKNVGAGKTVQVSGLTIGGANAGDYMLTQPTATASITALYLTVSGITADNKIYDGNTSATLNTSLAALERRDLSGRGDARRERRFGSVRDQDGRHGQDGPGVGSDDRRGGRGQLRDHAADGDGRHHGEAVDGKLHGSGQGLRRKQLGVGDRRQPDGRGRRRRCDAERESVGDVCEQERAGRDGDGDGGEPGGADAGNYTLFAPITTSAAITPRALAVTATGVSRTYDGGVTATVTLSDDRLGSDVFTSSYTSASFSDKNVGTGKSISVSGISISGADAVNYTANTTASATADITAKSLTVSAAGVNKVYDGLTSATVTLSDDRISGDVVTDNYTSASFATRNVGTGIAVSVSGISISGTDSGNYSLTSTTASATADITGRPLTISATGVNKIYDGSTTAAVTLADNRVSGDVFTDSYASASFSDKNVGTAKAVSVSGISISGVDAGNYTYNTTASTTADITAKSLTASFTASSKVYDGSTSAAVSGCALTGVVSPDDVSCAASNGQFDNASVGAGKTVTADVALSGADSGNYSVAATATSTADITKASLTVTGITASDKVYDQTTSATLNVAGAALVGVVSGDTVTLDTSAAVGTFSDKNVGAGKTVQVNGLTIGGANAGDYMLTQPTATASITQLYLTVTGITADNKIYDGNTSATLNTSLAALNGVISPDAVTLDASLAAGAFSTKTVGTAKTVQVSGLTIGGADVANYGITQPTATADITAKQLTASYTGVDKVYDGSASASVTGGTLSGVVGGDDVTLSGSPSATFASKNVPGGTVTVTGVSLAGADAGNYTLFAPITTSAAITPRALAVTATGVNKTYDGGDDGDGDAVGRPDRKRFLHGELRERVVLRQERGDGQVGQRLRDFDLGRGCGQLHGQHDGVGDGGHHGEVADGVGGGREQGLRRSDVGHGDAVGRPGFGRRGDGQLHERQFRDQERRDWDRGERLRDLDLGHGLGQLQPDLDDGIGDCGHHGPAADDQRGG